MLKIKVNTIKFDKKNQKIEKEFNRNWNMLLYKYGDLVTKRASNYHKYTNRSGGLSKSNKYKVTVKSKRLTFTNTKKYAKYVKAWEIKKGNKKGWFKNAFIFYKQQFKKDFNNISKYIK